MDGVVLAAGQGQRLRPLTEWLPKFMIPLMDRPMICQSFDFLAARGCSRIIAVLPVEGLKYGEVLRKVSGDVSLEIVACPVLGQIEALKRGAALVQGDFFWLVFCDNVFEPGVSLNIPEEFPQVFLAKRDQRLGETGRYGTVVTSPKLRILKKTPGELIQTGAFRLKAEIALSFQGEELVDLINASDFRMVEFDGWWVDVGQFDSLLETAKRLEKYSGNRRD